MSIANRYLKDIYMNLGQLKGSQEPPELFTSGESLWDDPYISKQMLAAHLDPTNDVASRRPETIDRSVSWLVDTLGLQPGSSVLDLGCGPGLYASRLAERGMQVTGVDYSRRSIAYAKEQAQQRHLDIQYRYQDYLTLEDENQYDAALLIYGDFCPLSLDQRSRLLRNVYWALKPGGNFVLDVTTRLHRKLHGSKNHWYVAEHGFWRSGLHLVLEQGFDYPEQDVFLDQVIVAEKEDRLSVYRMWFQDYDRDSIVRELESGCFAVQSVWSNLVGTPFQEDTEWIGVVAQKPVQ